MIDIDEPANWRAFQEWVARVLRESGLTVEVEKQIETARGVVVVDIWAHDHTGTPLQTYLMECKQWRSRVPKSVVHAFRMVVGDSGANWGAIVSAKGFQKGAHDAARYSNVRLLTWVELQELFEARWFERHFLGTIAEAAPLIEYTEPVNSRIFRKVDSLPAERRETFRSLRERHLGLGAVALQYLVPAIGPLTNIDRRPRVPLRSQLERGLSEGALTLPDSILDASCLRSLLAAILEAAAAAIGEFDEVFGERA
jgi:hypothetical protein